nr:DUF2141 domain-containing protein [Allomuricauda sp.]
MGRLIVLIMSFYVTGLAFAQEKCDITIEVTDISDEGKGQVVFMLWDKEDGFPNERNKAYKIGKVNDFGSSVSFTFKGVSQGTYAVSVHQDKDEDGEMKTNFIGIPREPVGASNLTSMGKPKFQKCKFSTNGAEEKINIKFIVAN